MKNNLLFLLLLAVGNAQGSELESIFTADNKEDLELYLKQNPSTDISRLLLCSAKCVSPKSMEFLFLQGAEANVPEEGCWKVCCKEGSPALRVLLRKVKSRLRKASWEESLKKAQGSLTRLSCILLSQKKVQEDLVNVTQCIGILLSQGANPNSCMHGKISSLLPYGGSLEKEINRPASTYVKAKHFPDTILSAFEKACSEDKKKKTDL